MSSPPSLITKYFYIMFILVVIEAIYLLHVYFVNDLSSTVYGSSSNSSIVLERYDSFEFDRANWTVYMKREGVNVDNDVQLKALVYKERVVKRIIHTNGTFENMGCTQNTSACYVGQMYDHVHKMRINTPPCCLQKLITLLQHFSTELRRYEVAHILTFGGVIGWVRYKHIIPYESDLDVVVDMRFWESPLMDHVIRRMRDLYGHVVKFTENGNKLWMGFSRTNHNRIDVWPYRVLIIHDQYMVTVPHSAWKYQPMKNIFPLRDVTFSGVRVFIPGDPIGYLNTQYGRGNWEREITCEIATNGKCQMHPSLLYTLFGLHWFV